MNLYYIRPAIVEQVILYKESSGIYIAYSIVDMHTSTAANLGAIKLYRAKVT
jgi:hypothetical protein